ncbi:MAG: DUF4340 domain-containing protein [Spirochaetaceae bacterium]|nr:DUF4340 domain-containing protein [Spirochaetaceae bacterium]
MTQKKFIFSLSVICFLLLFIYIFPFGDSKKEISLSTALLNPQQVKNIQEIEVFSEGNSLSIKKSDSCWIGTDGNVVFPIESENIDLLLSSASKIRSMNLISKDTSKHTLSDFGLDEQNYSRLVFKSNDNKIVSDLFFGKSNYSGLNIYIKTDKSPVYEIENDLYSWLQISIRQWADMKIIPLSILGKIKSNDVQSIKLFLQNQSNTLTTLSSDFYTKVDKILSLRGSKILPVYDIDESNFTGHIQIEIGNGSGVVLKIFSSGNDSSEYDSFYIIPDIKTGTGFGDINASKQCVYALEISNWTYENIIYNLAH